MTPLPPHIPGVPMTVNLNQLIDYYQKHGLEAAPETANLEKTLPVIVCKLGVQNEE